MNDFSLITLFQLIVKRIWLILIVSVLFATITFGYCTMFAVPTYVARASIIGSNGGLGLETEETATTIKSTDIASSLALMETYVGILQTSGIYEQTAANLGMDYKSSELRSMITVQNRSETQLFIDVSVVSKSQKDSVLIANAFANQAAIYIKATLPNAYAKPIEFANSAPQNYPQIYLYTTLAFILGAVVVIGISFLVSLFDQTIKGEEDFKDKYNLPVLGSVPDFATAAKGEK